MIEDPYPTRAPVTGETFAQMKARNLRERRARRRAKVAAWKADQGCTDCGEKDPVVLDLHHSRGEKLGVVSQIYGWSLDRLNAELAKCEVLCANCHRRRHASV